MISLQLAWESLITIGISGEEVGVLGGGDFPWMCPYLAMLSPPSSPPPPPPTYSDVVPTEPPVGPVVIEFLQAAYTVQESAGVASLGVMVTTGTVSRDISVLFSTADDTAEGTYTVNSLWVISTCLWLSEYIHCKLLVVV